MCRNAATLTMMSSSSSFSSASHACTPADPPAPLLAPQSDCSHQYTHRTHTAHTHSHTHTRAHTHTHTHTSHTQTNKNTQAQTRCAGGGQVSESSRAGGRVGGAEEASKQAGMASFSIPPSLSEPTAPCSPAHACARTNKSSTRAAKAQNEGRGCGVGVWVWGDKGRVCV